MMVVMIVVQLFRILKALFRILKALTCSMVVR